MITRCNKNFVYCSYFNTYSSELVDDIESPVRTAPSTAQCKTVTVGTHD